MQLKSGERVDELYSLGIKIIQNPRVFSFSIDAVLLAHFAKIKPGIKSLTVDLCSGNGAVGLFVSSKTRGSIVEVELQPKLAEMARRSVRLNHLTKQIKVVQGDLINASRFIPAGKVDSVVCNPPYFPHLKTSRINPNPYVAIARHEIRTNLDQVLSVISRLLKNRGHVFMVYRPGRLTELLDKMQKYGLAPRALQFAYSTLNRDSNLVLVDAIKRGKIRGVRILSPIITRNRDNSGYSSQMKKIMFDHW